MVEAYAVSWQNKTIPRSSDFRGVLTMGLLAAWFYFVWQFLSLPPFEALRAGLSPLLASALEKGKYMPDFGMIVAGFAAFHFRRELQKQWDRSVAVQVYLSAVVPLIVYLVVGVALLEAVHLVGPAHDLSRPWRDPLMAVQFRVLVTAIVFAFLWPGLLFWMWTNILDIGVAGVVLGLVYYGMNFTLGWHRPLYMWPVSALFDFMLGVSLCTTMFRAVMYLEPVRGAIMILGWVAILAGSILAGPAMFFLGFLMVAGGSAISERTWFIPGERALLAWSRTALGIVMVQPALFTAWLIWGREITGIGWAAFLALAVATQLVAIALSLVIEMPTRRLTPVMPA